MVRSTDSLLSIVVPAYREGAHLADSLRRVAEIEADASTATHVFGQALVALGVVKQDELEWGLASQHDLPYIFPDADAIDHLKLQLDRIGTVATG